MKKLPISLILKMSFVVALNLAALAWVFSPLARPACAYATIASNYVQDASRKTWDWAVDAYERAPSFVELADSFITILKKPLN